MSNRAFPSTFCIPGQGRKRRGKKLQSLVCSLPFSLYLNEGETESVIALLPSSIPSQPNLGKRLRGKGNVVGIAEMAQTVRQNFLLHRFPYVDDSSFGWSCFFFFFHNTEVLHALVSGTESFMNPSRIISHLLCRPWSSFPYRNVNICNSPLLKTPQLRARLPGIMRKRNWTLVVVCVFSKITSTHTNIYFQEMQRYIFCKTLHYFPVLVISWSVLLIW